MTVDGMIQAKANHPDPQPGQPHAESSRGWDRWLLGVLAVSAALGVYQIDWGLPVGTDSWTHSWTVDAMEPLTVRGSVHRSFSHWNSGWFYFKYPLGYPLLLTVVLAPYLAFLFLSGGWHKFTSVYPYGLVHPERTLFTLAILQRGLNVAFTLGTVALVYAIGCRLFRRQAALLAAWFVATAYPVVYYARTSNVDASYVFWLMLALYCAIVASETARGVPWLGLGLAAGMALSTKEQAFGFLLPLPVLVLTARARAQGGVRVLWSRPVLLMAAVGIGTVVVANNALFNPLGMVARIAFLMGHPLQPVDVPLRPVEFSWFKGQLEWTYLQQLWESMDSGVGMPVACLAIAGAVALWRVPRAAAWLLAPMIGYYFLSLRAQVLISLRYSLPIVVLAALPAAALLDELRIRSRPGAVRTSLVVATLLLAALGLSRAIELTLLLRNDSRRQAEAWMTAHVPDGTRGEIYQKLTYLPRFPRRLHVTFIEMPQRSVEQFEQRQPDFVVLSSASRKTATHIWNPDWRTTQTVLLAVPEATRFIGALRKGGLGYHPVATFRQQPRLLHVRTTGLCPEITIYARDGSPFAAPDARHFAESSGYPGRQ
jgi:4-amino-4-deoxy-L-arabinose transferase-like glycosyltransferase